MRSKSVRKGLAELLLSEVERYESKAEKITARSVYADIEESVVTMHVSPKYGKSAESCHGDWAFTQKLFRQFQKVFEDVLRIKVCDVGPEIAKFGSDVSGLVWPGVQSRPEFIRNPP